MRKGVYAVILSTLIALLSLISMASPAFASTKQSRVTYTESAPLIRTEKYGFYPRSRQWQVFAGRSYSKIHLDFRGHNQNNSGNEGHNRGYNLNFGDNGGNLIISRGYTRRSQWNRQYFHGTSYSWNTGRFEGYNQNNTGNQGYNEGYNEDHGGNAGNQIVN